MVVLVREQAPAKKPAPPPAKKTEPAPKTTPAPAAKTPAQPVSKTATVPYNPYGYVPGGSSARVGQTIEAQAIETPGSRPVRVPIGIEADIPPSTEVVAPGGAVVQFGKGPEEPQRVIAPPPEIAGPSPADSFLAGADPLAHAAAFQAIRAACDLYGIEAKAACADGLHEGFHGGIGDGGTAYGPWQEHLTDGRILEIAGLEPDDGRVQAWAWSAPGIAHGVRGMAVDTPSARGLSGHAAVHAIVYGFERPADEGGAYATRADEYDHLVSLGAGWEAYAIANLNGPGLPGTTPEPLTPPIDATPTTPTGAAGAWKEMMHALAVTLPTLGVEAEKVGKTLPGV